MAKILLVEDDKSLREIYGVRLQAEGYTIISAGDGEEALAVAIKERPDLIVSDVMMPKISGFDMLDILRSTTETKDIKVIMMTALSSEDQRARGEALGADRYLVKSQVGIEDVVRTVHDVLADGVPSVPAPAPVEAPVPEPTPAPVVAPAAAPEVPPVAPTPVTPVEVPAPVVEAPAPVAPEPVAAPIAGEPVPTPPATPAPVEAPTTPPVAPVVGAPVVPTPPVAPITPPVAEAAFTPAPAPTVPTPTPVPTPIPVTAPVEPLTAAEIAPTVPAPVTFPPSVTLPEPTAPFSSDPPASLGDRIINPLPSADSLNATSVSDIATQMNQELNAHLQGFEQSTVPASPIAPAPAPNPYATPPQPGIPPLPPQPGI